MSQHKHPFSQEALIELVANCLQRAKRTGVDQVEAVVTNELGFAVTARQGEVETLEHHQAQGLVVTVYSQQRVGSANTSDLTSAAVDATVDKACAIANYSECDPYAGLADQAHMANHYPQLDLFHHWDITPAEAIQMAIECETVARQQDERIIHAEGATVATYDYFRVYANSHGFIGHYPASSHRISCGVVAEENGQMQRNYEYTAARKAQDLDDLVAVAKHAAHKTISRLGARKIKTQNCPVVFHAPVAKGLLGHFIRAISGRSQYMKASFLLDHLNKAVFPAHINIYQEPHLLGAMGSAPFDSEGVATQERHYVKNGELVSYALGSYSARKLGMETTGNAGGVYNLSITHSDLNLSKLLQNMEKGLLVTEMMGQGVNLVTGDYSRGAAGYWVENGEIQYPVEEITIAGNLRDMFASLVAVGNDIDQRGNNHTGSIMLEQMTISGV